MASGEVAKDWLKGLYLADSVKAVHILFIDGTSKWIPLQFLHSDWDRSVEIWQEWLVEAWFLNWSEKENGWL